MRMNDQNDALSDTLKALLSLFLMIVTSCFDLSNKYVYRYRTTFFFFLQKTHRLFYKRAQRALERSPESEDF